VPATPRPRVFASDFEKRHEDRFRGRQFDWLRFQRDGANYPVPNSADPYVTPPQEIFISGAGSERQLTRLGLRPSGTEWRPDGMALLFTADSSYRNERSYEHGQIWSVTFDGTARRLSTDLDYDYSDASYSPDGRWILYTKQISTDAVITRRMDNGGPTDLAVMPADGGAERLLTADWDYLPAGARFSPDGKYVYFNGGIGGTNHLFRVPVTGGPVEQVTKGERRLAGFSFDRGMTKVAFSVGKMESPSDISIARIDGTKEQQLTRLNEGFTREVALDAPERLSFRSKDGTPIEGWLWRPYGYRPGAAGGARYPLIVFSHGGPHSATGYGFDFKLQYFAANGYFVLATNFRSSTGYGEKFLWATWGGWGNKDGEDVMAGVDYVIAHAPIDPARVATVGHSYGGFMSNWLITQYPDRFAAAAVGAGIVNWVSDYGTADIARTKETEFYGTPWDPAARELMMRQSPLTYANRVKAATLFINGEIDERVPYSEAEQMFVALRKNGVPAKVIQYAGQPHGIAGAWNNVHRMLNELRWLNTWLAPAAQRPVP
jgi:dipeptidyl aminopeptidase/acylaminoacyl peptidase